MLSSRFAPNLRSADQATFSSFWPSIYEADIPVVAEKHHKPIENLQEFDPDTARIW